MNSVTLIGRLTADPELKFFSSGVAISKLTVAIDRSYRKDNQSVTDFIPVEVWGKKAEYCATYIEKGCLVAVSGSLHIDRYVDSIGNNKTFAKVVANSITKLNSPNRPGTGGSDNSNNGGNSDAGNGSGSSDGSASNNAPISGNGTNSTGNTKSSSTTDPSNPADNLKELAGDDEIPF
ncbi:single-stranded DNA-binding protein [Intestinibacter bartlettii]|uniref:Single-stranded DNA-binding protein n=1 Tax=Intestinibacter bartlettii TaxID=261299 RepID=A0ABS6DUV1_9FIRM|nr:single-stranded DNA-binding protein [Intestinibacter bartlettii]MBU5335472.1 single-stranded DNA-binding protein [Intestinibacter bartlettii]